MIMIHQVEILYQKKKEHDELKFRELEVFNEPDLSQSICHLDFNHSNCVVGHSYYLKKRDVMLLFTFMLFSFCYLYSNPSP